MTGVIIIRRPSPSLRPLASWRPLSLHNFIGAPLIERQLGALFSAGVSSVAVLSETDRGLKDWYSSRAKGGPRVSFTLTKEKSALAFLRDYRDTVIKNGREPFFLLEENCILQKNDLTAIIDDHKELSADMTVAVRETVSPDRKVWSLSSLGRVDGVFTPPSVDYGYSDFVSSGAAVLSSRLLGLITAESGGIDDLASEAASKLSVFAKETSKDAAPITDAASYRAAATFFILQTGNKTKKGHTALTPSFEGAVKIASEAVIGPFSHLSDGVTVGALSTVKNTVICENAAVGRDTLIDGAILLEGATVGNGAKIYEDAVIGAGASVADGETVPRGVKIPDFRGVGAVPPPALSGGDAYALGKKAGEKYAVITVGSSSAAPHKDLARLFADGAASAGSTAVLAASVPECVWRHAAFITGSGGGVYFGEEGPLFSGERGLETVLEPSDSLPRGVGSRRDLSEVLDLLYAERVASLMSPKDGFEVSSESEYLQKAYGRFGTEGGASFYVSENGASFSLSDEKGIYLSEDKTPALAAFAILSSKGRLFVPENYPLADNLLERATGGTVVRLAAGEREGLAEALGFYDAAFMISEIMNASRALKRPVFSLAAAMPRYFVKKESYPAGLSQKNVSRLMSAETSSLDGGGRAFLSFDRLRPTVTVTAVAETEAECDRILALYK